MIGVVKFNLEGPESKAGMDRVSRFGFSTIYCIQSPKVWRPTEILSQRFQATV